MNKIQKTAVLGLMVFSGAAVGWFMGNQQYGKWFQQYAEMDESQNFHLLANVPLVKYEKKFDFGILTGDVGILTHEFLITNTGRGTLVLKNPEMADDSVQCSLSQMEVAPDETLRIMVSLRPNPEETDFVETVYVPTNAPTEPELELTLVGAVYPAVWPEEKAVEVAGVPATNVFKTSNRIFSIKKDSPLEITDLHITDPQYADFFEFETVDLYSYDFAEVSPKPEAGKIVAIRIKPGLPDKIFTVTVEGKTNFTEMPTIRFNIDFKAPAIHPLFGTENPGFVPRLPRESSEQESASEPVNASDHENAPEPANASERENSTENIPEKIDLESENHS